MYIPVVNVEHPLDAKIPFSPRYVGIYMDFSPCWIRALAFLLHNFGNRAKPYVKEYLKEVESMYQFAARIYSQIMSTTNRPHYAKSFLFNVIYAFDPHLMCIPSLHVMIVVFLYTKMKYIMECLGEDGSFYEELNGLFRHAVAITDSILFVKQHSVNCVAAGMFAIHNFAPALFTRAETFRFADALLRNAGNEIPETAGAEIRAYIYNLFLAFTDSSQKSLGWEYVLIDFLKEYPSSHAN